jgi:FkbM family methyltransferase
MKFKDFKKKTLHQIWEVLPGNFIFNCQINELNFKYYTNRQDALFREALVSRLTNFEKESIRYWISALINGGVSVDIGAYTGVYSILASRAGSDFTYCFEPNQQIAKFLMRNLQINGLNNNVSYIDKALGSSITEKNLLVPKTRIYKLGKKTGSGAQIEDAKSYRNLDEWVHLAKIPISTLDQELSHLQPNSVRAIKIDVEGYELEVLRGAIKILKMNKPLLIIESLNKNSEKEIVNFLKHYGYELMLKDGHNLIF